jgi:hypothetical protein
LPTDHSPQVHCPGFIPVGSMESVGKVHPSTHFPDSRRKGLGWPEARRLGCC